MSIEKSNKIWIRVFALMIVLAFVVGVTYFAKELQKIHKKTEVVKALDSVTSIVNDKDTVKLDGDAVVYDGGNYTMITSNMTTTWDYNTYHISRKAVKRIRKTKDDYIIELKPGWNQ